MTVDMCDQKVWNVRASNLAANTHNPIRAIVESLQLEPNPSKQMISLSIGDPTIFGNLTPPRELIDAVLKSVDCGNCNGYAPSIGTVQARQAVADYSSSEGLTVDWKDVILCSGCSTALDLCISVLANPGDNVLIPRPGFSLYRTLAEGLGIRVKPYNLKPESRWEADLNHLESQIDCNTKAIVVNNPSNPCGSVFSKKHLKEILEVASRNRLPIIADEIYEHLVFAGEEFFPLASLSSDVPILSCSGLTKSSLRLSHFLCIGAPEAAKVVCSPCSHGAPDADSPFAEFPSPGREKSLVAEATHGPKGFLVPGWRVGWIVIHDRNGVFGKEVKSGLVKLSQRQLGCNTIVQGALAEILKITPSDFYNNTIKTLQKNAIIAYKRLSDIPGLTPVMPQGAMYIMIGIDMKMFPGIKNDLEFVEMMVTEESVFCLPGKCFDYPNFVRIIISPPEEMLKEACERIADFCQRHYKAPSKRPSDNLTSYREVGLTDSPHSEISGRNLG